MRLTMIVEPGSRLPQLNLVPIPDGANDAQVRASLLNQYDLEIGSGPGSLTGKTWRIGLMGRACNQKNVLLYLFSLNRVLSEQGASINSGVAIPAVMGVYS